MRIPRKLLWLAFFVFCTFGWSVFFQHGAEPGRMLDGARTEISQMLRWLARMLAGR
jgi:hypothetical protein